MNTILKLFGITLFISFSAFSVFSQENSSEKKVNEKALKQENALEQAREERLRLQEEMKMNRIIYQESVREYRKGFNERRDRPNQQDDKVLTREQLRQDRLEIQLNRVRFEESVKEFKKAVREDKYQRSLTKKYAVGFYPFTLMMDGGLKFDFGMRIAQRQWLQIAPTAYLFPGVSSSYSDFCMYCYDYYYDDYYYRNEYNVKTQKGAGIDLSYKFFLHRNFLYFLAGVNYSYHHVGYEYHDYAPFQEDGLNYYKYMKITDIQNFNNFKTYAGCGLQTIHTGFFIGGHLGLGYQYSFYDNQKAALNKNVFDYGYRGLYPVIDFKLGYAW